LPPAHRARRARRRRPLRLPRGRDSRAQDRGDGGHRGRRRRLLFLPPGRTGAGAAVLATRRSCRRPCQRDRPEPDQAGVEGEATCREVTDRWQGCGCWISPGYWPGRSAR
ncbi:MAG: hypothetical protein EHM88_01395, partial [Candidatus Rokuibacteriota bacterium]